MSKANKVVVFGGSGMIGSMVVAKLAEAGIDVHAASRRTGVDIITGQGLCEVLKGVDIVIDASDVPVFDLETLGSFFKFSGKNIFQAEKDAGVKHHITLSIVGVDTVDGNPYFDAKRGQEEMARNSGIPYTIARSTQFYEFFNTIASGFTQDGVAKLPDALFQPLAAADVASALVDIALSKPKNSAVTIAGSECVKFETWFQRFFALTQDKRIASTDKHATYFGGKLKNDSIVPGMPDYLGKLSFEEWVASPTGLKALHRDRYADATAELGKHAK